MKKSLTLLSFAVVSALAAVAVAQTTPTLPPGTPASPAPQAAMPSKNTMPAVPGKASEAGDAAALGLLAAINQHEIDAAKQAESKKVTGNVLAYAKKMEKEHGENLAKTKSLGTLSTGADVQAQKAAGKKHLAELGKKTGKDYETAYVDAMVKGHADVLAKIDGTLLPMAQTAAVKQHLTETRGHVAMHLDEAKALQAAR